MTLVKSLYNTIKSKKCEACCWTGELKCQHVSQSLVGDHDYSSVVSLSTGELEYLIEELEYRTDEIEYLASGR